MTRNIDQLFFPGFILAAFLALSPPSFAQAQSSTDRDTIRVLILEDFPPQFVSTPEGPSGLAVDVMREVTQGVGLEVEFVTVKSWKDVYAPLKDGTVDVLSSMGVSEARQKLVEFTRPYEVFDIKLFVRTETSDIETIDDLSDRRLGVQKTNILSKALIESQKYSIKLYPTFEAAFLGLLAGEVDAVPAPTEPFFLIARAARLDDRIKVVGPSMLEVKRAMALPKGQTGLRDILDKGLDEFLQTDAYKALLTKWYGTPTPYWNKTRIFVALTVVFLTILVLMGLWRYRSIVELSRRIQKNEERFTLAMRGANDGLWDWDLKTNHVYYSPRWGEMLGYSEEEIEPLLGAWKRLVDPRDRDRVLRETTDCIEGKARSLDTEFRMQHKDGSVVNILSRAFLVYEAGEAVRFVGTHVDVTEREILGEQLRQSQKMEAVGQLAGGVAHDFNNLLSVMVGNAEILEDEVGANTSAQRNIQAIINSVDRGASLTSRLLAFSRQQTLKPTPTNISDLVADLIDLLQRTLGATIELKASFEADIPDALIDQHMFENALINLAINARDAMPDGGVLNIEISDSILSEAYVNRKEDVKPGDYIKIAVSDTGNGMTPEILKKVFEPFFTTKDIGEGSGLGLSMVFGFVKQSKGHVTIYSEPNKGTTVELYLPQSTATKTDAAIIGSKPLHEAGVEGIGIVEDGEDILEISATTLKKQGYEIIVV